MRVSVGEERSLVPFPTGHNPGPVHEDIMATASSPFQHPAPPREYNPMAGVLSYLVPGLGQIVQGRVAKGILFLVCIYTLFFYGLYLGSGSVKIGQRTFTLASNVYLPDTTDPSNRRGPLYDLGTNLYNRPQFVGQFWAGIVVWPAILQYISYNRDGHQDLEDLYSQAEHSVKQEDPERAEEQFRKAEIQERQLAHPLVGSFEREPPQASINAVHNAGDKRLELAWVFTVIAGVLNILVIYDAVAGPAVVQALARQPQRKAA
jgi:hypothetical protein